MTNGKLTRMGKMSLLERWGRCMHEGVMRENVIIVPLGDHRKA